MKKINKALFFLIILTFFSLVALSAQEGDSPKSNWTVKPSFTFQQRFKVQTKELEAKANDIGIFETPFFSRSQITANLDLGCGSFHFIPYLYEQFEAYVSMSDPIKIADGGDLSMVNFRGQNRLGFGSHFNYINPNILSIRFNLEQMLQANFTANKAAKAKVHYLIQPTLQLGGKYDFGFSWGIRSTVRFPFDEKSISLGAKPLPFLLYFGGMNLDYEVLHWVNPKMDHKLFLFSDFSYFYKDGDPYGNAKKGSFNSDTVFGLRYQYKVVSPKVGILWYQDFDRAYENRKNGCGFVSGVTIQKGQYKFDFAYTGAMQTSPGGDGKWQNELLGICTIHF